jgi:putative transposase
VLEVSTSGYYAWRSRKPCARALEDAELTAQVKEIHLEHKSRYGSPRIERTLRRKGRKVSRKRVARLMRESGLVARRRRRFRPATTDSKHEFPIAPNLLKRDFSTSELRTVMVGDTTAVATQEGWLYLAVLLDLASRAIVGWAFSEHNDAELVCRALRMAVARGFRKGFIHHSDRGSTYASAEYRRLLKAAGGRCSMSRKADCYDNAVAESVFKTIKEETFTWADMPATKAEARSRIFAYVEGYYNRHRLHSSLDYLTPDEFENLKIENRSEIVQNG